MATERPTNTVNTQMLKLYIDTIPNFNGDGHTLEIFLEHCDSLMTTYQNSAQANDPINNLLIRAIISKLTGNALILVGSRPEIRQWTELKTLLRLTFGDQRSLDCLVQEMIIMRPQKTESFFSFGQRIQKCRSGIASKLKSLNLSCAERILQIKNYDDLSLKTFIRGLTGRVQDMVRLRNPDSLEVAISYVLEEENFILSQKQSSVMTHNNRPPQKQNYNNQNTHFQQKYSNQTVRPHNFQNYSNPTQSQNYFRPQFPSQPINIQPRQNMPPQKLFSNSEVFGPPRNVFQPTGKPSNFKPEPMSVSTRNTSQKPNFKNYSQEIYNIETADDFLEPEPTLNPIPAEYNYNNSQVDEYAEYDYNPMHENDVSSHENYANEGNFCQPSTSNDPI